MANYLIKESTLKSIADNVRTMQGSTSSMTASEMATQLESTSDGIGNEITTQTDLITQIQSALEGKAAGSGSGGLSLETCTLTVTVNFDDNVNEDFGIIFEGIVSDSETSNGMYTSYLGSIDKTMTHTPVELSIVKHTPVIIYPNAGITGHYFSVVESEGVNFLNLRTDFEIETDSGVLAFYSLDEDDNLSIVLSVTGS